MSAARLNNRQPRGDKPMDAKQTVNKLIITVDTSFEQIVEYDNKGASLIFSARLGTFKELSESELAQLSVKSRERYFVTKELYDERLVDEPVTDVANLIGATDANPLIDTGYGLKINTEAGSATDRLNFTVDKGRKKSDYFFARAEDVDEQLGRGAKVATEGVRSWGNKGSGIHRLTKRGHDELVMMFKEDRVAREAAEIEQRYNSRVNANTDEHQALAKKVSGAKFVSEKDDRFRDIN